MLKQLYIKNYALIRELTIMPSGKLNIVTGETGAGKSIMLGALGLLLGNRADTRVMFDQNEKCIIEAQFDVSAYAIGSVFEQEELDFDTACILRREISPSGKSRAFVNDTPVNLETLKRISGYLMDIHSQHDTLLLGAEDFQLGIVDVFAQNTAVKHQYTEAYKVFRQAARRYEQLIKENADMKKEFDFQHFLFTELDDARLDTIDQETLEQELERLENTEQIKSALNAVLQQSSENEYSVENGLRSLMAQLSPVRNFGQQYSQLYERLESLRLELKDIIAEVEDEEGRLFHDDERIAQVKQVLDKLYNLQQKHRLQSVAELVALREELRSKIERVLNFDEDIAQAKTELETAQNQLNIIGQQLTATRLAVFEPICGQVNDLLRELGMPNARLSIAHQAIAATPEGLDAIAFLFSANKGIAPDNLKNVASGGEFSRLMLCIKYILADKIALPTIIFDEIDTGISGEIAMKVGNMMLQMAERHQVISISHLPQIAAKGEKHYFVYKDDSSDRAISRIKELNDDERIQQIAQMIGGANPSAIAYLNARELLGKEIVD